MNPSRFKEVLAWLDAGAPHLPKLGRYEDVGFNMREYIDLETKDYTGRDCGTTCCIAGYVMAKQGHRSAPDASKYLGLSWGISEALFRGYNFVDGNPVYGEDGALVQVGRTEITPAMAAATIRHMLETGNVIWEGAE